MDKILLIQINLAKYLYTFHNGIMMGHECNIKLSVREFGLPLVRDALILGKQAPIGAKAMCKVLEYLHGYKFECFEINDHVIETIFVRSNLLARTNKDKLIKFLLENVKAVMRNNEIIQINIELETIIEGTI